MASIAGITIAEFFIWMAAAYVLWLQVALISAIAHAHGHSGPFNKLFDRFGAVRTTISLVIVGWIVIYVVFALPIRIGFICAIDGALVSWAVWQSADVWTRGA